MADPAARPGSGHLDPEAHQSHHRRRWRTTRAKRPLGQKVHPYGFPVGHPLRVAVQLVRRAHYAEFSSTRTSPSGSSSRRSSIHAGISKGRDRAGRREGGGEHPHGAPGHPDRPRGAEVETLRKRSWEFTPSDVFINIKEIRKAELDAQLVAENIALQLERRVAFRRAMKKAMISTMKFGAEGIRSSAPVAWAAPRWAAASGIATAACPFTPSVPTSTTAAEAKTTYGVIGVKCWVFKGEVSDKELRQGRWPAAADPAGQRSRGRGTDAPAEEGQASQDVQKGRMRGKAHRGNRVSFGDYGLQAVGAGRITRAPDRGCPYRDDPSREARRQGLDRASSRTSRSRRSPPRPGWVRARGTPRPWVAR